MPVKIRGLKELDRKLQELPRRVAKKHLSGAVRKAAILVKNDAKNRAPVSDAAFDFAKLDSGRLKRNIVYFKIRERNTSHSVTYGVAARTDRKKKRDDPRIAWYWHFVEFGTRFQAAQPFLRPAFEANKRRAIGVIARELRKRIATEAKKL